MRHQARSGQRPAINLSLASYPGLGHYEAMLTANAAHAAGTLSEPLWGALCLDHVQIVPQGRGLFQEELAQRMRQDFPGTAFRLHANVRVLSTRVVYDLSNFGRCLEWFTRAAAVQRVLGGKVYSAHAGYKANATLAEMFDNARRASDLFEMPVAIEGLYPDRCDTQLMSTWADYQALLDCGLPYALDLSHLNIVARKSRKRELGLVQELMASDCLLEAHVSENDGFGDQHQVCDRP